MELGSRSGVERLPILDFHWVPLGAHGIITGGLGTKGHGVGDGRADGHVAIHQLLDIGRNRIGVFRRHWSVIVGKSYGLWELQD